MTRYAFLAAAVCGMSAYAVPARIPVSPLDESAIASVVGGNPAQACYAAGSDTKTCVNPKTQDVTPQCTEPVSGSLIWTYETYTGQTEALCTTLPAGSPGRASCTTSNPKACSKVQGCATGCKKCGPPATVNVDTTVHVSGANCKG